MGGTTVWLWSNCPAKWSSHPDTCLSRGLWHQDWPFKVNTVDVSCHTENRDQTPHHLASTLLDLLLVKLPPLPLCTCPALSLLAQLKSYLSEKCSHLHSLLFGVFFIHSSLFTSLQTMCTTPCLHCLPACSLVHTSAQMLLGWMDGWFLSLKTTLRVCYRSRGPNSHLNLTYVSLGFELGEQPSIAHIQLNQQTRILALQSRIALFFWHPATSKGCLWPGLIPGPTLPGLWPWSFRHTHPISSSLPPFSQF